MTARLAKPEKDPGDEIVMTISGKEYTQKQISKLAFHCYLYTRKNLEAGFTTWRRLVWPNETTQKDWLFLALYYLDKEAYDIQKETYAEDLELIKESVK